jgi:CHAD domain-containing protein
VTVADRLPPGDERDTEWHEARKAAKRLRYAGEAAAPALGKPAKKLVKRVKQVQELLGDHQDAAVARPVLREIGIAAHWTGRTDSPGAAAPAADRRRAPLGGGDQPCVAGSAAQRPRSQSITALP